jgi:hypothetical protein
MEGNKNIKGVWLRTTRGVEIKGIYAGLPNWRPSFLRRIRRKRRTLSSWHERTDWW